MAVTYEKTFEIEIINELSASVYNRVLNYVLNHELNKNDSQLLEVNLLNQLKLAKRVNLFDYSLEELQAVHEYWRSMNRYSKQVLNKGKFYQFNLSSCIRQQNSLTAQFVSFSLSNLANIFYPPQFLQ